MTHRESRRRSCRPRPAAYGGTEHFTRCGRPDCGCHDDPPRLHGPYGSWTRKVDNKTVTRLLTAEQLKDYRPLFDYAR